MSTSYTDVFTGKAVTPAFPQYTAVALTGNIQLSWPAQFQNTNHVVSVTMDITPNAAGRTVTMPDAREAGTGFTFIVNNPSNLYSLQLLTYTGTPIVTVAAEKAHLIWLIDNSVGDGAGSWRQIPAFGTGGGVTSVNATSNSNNLLVTGVPALPLTTGGTLQFSLQNDLLALTQFGGGSVGFAVRTATNTWALRALQQTTNQILITNASGTVDNPIISLAPNITGVNSLALAGLSFGVAPSAINVIASTGGNTNIEITPNGTGIIGLNTDTKLARGKNLKFVADNGINYISFRAGATSVSQELVWPTSVGGPGQVLANNGFESLYWASIPTVPGTNTTTNAVVRFSNTTGGLKDSPNFIATDAGAVTGLSSCEISSIFIAKDGLTVISTKDTDDDLVVAPNGNGNLRTQGSIIITSSQGFQRHLRIYNKIGDRYSGFRATETLSTDILYTLPPTGGAAGYFVTNAANEMSIRPLPTPLVTVVDFVPKFSDTVGTLVSSALSISGAGAATGLASLAVTGALTGASVTATGTVTGASLAATSSVTGATVSATGALSAASATIGAFSIAAVANTISATGTNIILSPAAGEVITTKNIQINSAGSALQLKLYNTAGTFFAGLKATAAMGTPSYTWSLPAADSSGYIKSDGAGNLSIATQVPTLGKYIQVSDGTAFTNTTTETSWFTGASGVGSRVLAANTTAAGMAIRFAGQAQMATDATGNFTLRVKGTTGTIFSCAFTIGSFTSRVVTFDILITLRTATTTHGRATIVVDGFSITPFSAASALWDASVSQTLDVTIQFAALGALNTCTTKLGVLETIYQQ